LGQNHQKNAFSADLTPPKMPDTILVGIPFVIKMPSDCPESEQGHCCYETLIKKKKKKKKKSKNYIKIKGG